MATFYFYWQDTDDVIWQDTDDVIWQDWSVEIVEIPPILDVEISVTSYDVAIDATDYEVNISLE